MGLSKPREKRIGVRPRQDRTATSQPGRRARASHRRIAERAARVRMPRSTTAAHHVPGSRSQDATATAPAETRSAPAARRTAERTAADLPSVLAIARLRSQRIVARKGEYRSCGGARGGRSTREPQVPE